MISLTPCDFSPGEQQRLQAGIFSITEEERGKFEERHQGHQLERLEVRRNSYASEDPWSDPTREGFFEATDSQGGNFVVKQWREKTDEPMSYELVGRGCIRIENKEIEVQEAAIKEQLRLEAQDRQLVIDEQVEGFLVELLKAHAGFLLHKKNPEGQMVFNDNPLMVWFRLNESFFSPILSLLKTILGKREYRFIEDFVEQHNEFNDVLSLKIKRRFEVVAFEFTNRLEG